MTSYLQRVQAAAAAVLAREGTEDEHPPFDPEKVGVLAVLKPYQVEGVSWLVRRFVAGVNVILGDEMGLGKTLQAISLLGYLKFHHLSTGPFLVLCPLSVSDGWMSEFAKFCPSLQVLRYVGDKASRSELRRTLHEHVKQKKISLGLPFDVLLTTYDIALMDQDFLSQIPWHYTIIDEAQRLKNSSSVLYQTLEQKFIMPRRLLMTVNEAEKVNETLKVLRNVLSIFMLRRTKSTLVASGTLTLPPLTEITVMSPLVSLQKRVYLSILKKELSALLAASLGSASQQSLQNIVIQLRKACSHPYLFNGIEPEPYKEGEHLVQASGKLIVLDQLLRKFHSSGHRVLLFAQMTHTLDILQDFLELRGYTYNRLDGSIRAEERFAAIRGFSHKSTEKFNDVHAFVFLISTRAGGVGLNLIAADTVIFYEQDWNPQVDKQALQRAHRIGQTNHVLSINLVTAGTVEEVIMRRAERKLQLSLNVIGEEHNLLQESRDIHAEFGNLRSLIVGFHMFDPTNTIGEEDNSDINLENLEAVTEKVARMRDYELPVIGDRKFEINSSDLLQDDHPSVARFDVSKCELDLDEDSYRSWVEKLKNASGSVDSVISEPTSRRNLTENISKKPKVEKNKAEEKNLAKWEAMGYRSLAVKSPVSIPDSDMVTDSGAVQFVYGDCTKPFSMGFDPAVVFSCIDDSGSWGHGGMFDALSSFSARIPEAYERAHECGDLHLGDLHLIELEAENKGGNDSANAPLWVALAVVQSYNSRRKEPRSNISIPHLEECLLKASSFAVQNSDRSEWNSVERLLRKYSSLFGIKIFVYYYRKTT